MEYIIYINSKEVATISGCEAAYEAYRHAVAMADIAGVTADLVDGSTGEVLESNDDFFDDEEVSDEELEEGFDPLEMGFNPYEGCYDYDC